MIACGAVINLKLLCGNCHIVCSDQLGVQTCCLIAAEFHFVSLDFAVKPANILPVHSVVAASSLPQFFCLSPVGLVLLKMLADMLRWKAPLVLILLHLCLVNNYACDHDEASFHGVKLLL